MTTVAPATTKPASTIHWRIPNTDHVPGYGYDLACGENRDLAGAKAAAMRAAKTLIAKGLLGDYDLVYAGSCCRTIDGKWSA